MKTIIVWFRNDLRVHDHPALAHAVQDADQVIPLFIFNEKLLHGRHAGSNRNRFLIECLEDLKASLNKQGADLVIRKGDPDTELQKLIEETKSDAVYYTADYTPYAIKRDKRVKAAIGESTTFRSFPGRLIISNLDTLQTKTKQTYKVFTPFWKTWSDVQHRAVANVPKHIPFPANIVVGHMPAVSSLVYEADLAKEGIKGGELAARKQLKDFLDHGVEDYRDNNNNLGLEGTSRLSAYFHFGCLSPREIEDMLPPGPGARSWHRQLAWRDFYHYILLHYPDNATKEFQERYRNYPWESNPELLKAWQDGQTGYPVVDAAMRQLNREGWMHNRGRLIVGSFLTKDLGIDWREGETYFMRMLQDGDEANNNGNWQWIASVGVDPAPVFRRLYNPASQQKNYDPSGAYVRKFVPELAQVPDKYVAEPWTMPEDVQQEVGCIIGKDYPAPIVDHKEARLIALDKYKHA